MAGTSPSHPKYSDMIIEAIQSNKADGNMNTSRQVILKYITSKYGIEPTTATNFIKKNLKTMLESELIKQAASDGKKGAGSFRYGLVLFSLHAIDSKNLRGYLVPKNPPLFPFRMLY